MVIRTDEDKIYNFNITDYIIKKQTYGRMKSSNRYTSNIKPDDIKNYLVDGDVKYHIEFTKSWIGTFKKYIPDDLKYKMVFYIVCDSLDELNALFDYIFKCIAEQTQYLDIPKWRLEYNECENGL